MTSDTLTTRPLGLDDAGFAVAVVARLQPHHPWHLDELLTHWRTSDRTGRAARLAVERGGEPLGWVEAVIQNAAAAGEGRIWAFLPGAAGAAELDAAWVLAEDAARGLGIRLALTNVWETEEPTLAVLDRRGWERTRRERFWRLELAGQRERLSGLRDAARRRVEAAGLAIATAADLGGESIYPQLHRVEAESAADIPRDTPHVPIPYEAWVEWMVPPAVLPERLWIATAGGRPVGVSYLDYRSTPVATGYTGVLAEHRGAGLARALKLETLVQAAELGVEAVETDNDDENAPILHLNAELGYRQIAGLAKLRKVLTTA